MGQKFQRPTVEGAMGEALCALEGGREGMVFREACMRTGGESQEKR